MTVVTDTPSPAVDTAHYHPLDPRVRYLWLIGSLIGTVFVAGLVMIPEFLYLRGSTRWPLPVPVLGLIAGVVVLLLSIWWSVVAYKRFGFLLTENELIVRGGVVFQSRRCIPRTRIQHVDIVSGPIDRAFGLVEVNLYVAGSLGPVAQIEGLSPHVAEQLKEALVVATADGV
jgi:membrane protein YdbS with pleckstrin-like domain